MFKFFIMLFLCPFFASAVVDTKSAGYSKTYIDFNFAIEKYGFKLERAYNSRSIYNGLFGFGWCSNLETVLMVLPDNSVKVTECGGGMEVFLFSKKPKTKY